MTPTLKEVAMLLGEKDLVIFDLQKQVVALADELNSLKTEPPHATGNQPQP